MKRAVLYLRVSTLDQTTANQERELRQVAERAGWHVLWFDDYRPEESAARVKDALEIDGPI